jgi:hypothetical protein
VTVARKAAILLDRTAVLFLGLALGGVITYSFFTGGQAAEAGPTGALPRQQAAAAGVTPAAAPADIPA